MGEAVLVGVTIATAGVVVSSAVGVDGSGVFVLEGRGVAVSV